MNKPNPVYVTLQCICFLVGIPTAALGMWPVALVCAAGFFLFWFASQPPKS
jgi:hypothetical protein